MAVGVATQTKREKQKMKTIEIMMDDDRVEYIDHMAKRDGISWDEAATKLVELALEYMGKKKIAC
jgi:phage antirepressor YoqD-like protein